MNGGDLKFTRDGSFSVDAQGQFVTKDGYRVHPGFVLPPGTKSLNITKDGSIDAYFSGDSEPENLGQLPIFTFINPVGLRSEGGNLYSLTVASGEAIETLPGENNAGMILQGTLETSNVNVMTEMTDLIKAQRAYETNAKVMGVADQMLQTVNNIR